MEELVENEVTEIEHEVPPASPNFRTELAKQLTEILPEAIADGKIDAKKLVELLGDDASSDAERFGLFWPGKQQAIRAAQSPTTATLRPSKDESVNWDATSNIFIEGDNLEVLKVLQRHYHSKFQLIYIDPPYNTGTSMIYSNNFESSLENYLEATKQSTSGGVKLVSNPESSGRIHSDWLSMMMPRMKLARNLLTDDGFVVFAIDHNELADLTLLANEIFGESNRIGILSVVHKPEGRNQEKFFGTSNEFMLVYAKNKNRADFQRALLDGDQQERYEFEDNRGKYYLKNFIRFRDGKYSLRENKPHFYYPVYVSPDLTEFSLKKIDGYHEVFPITDKNVERTWKTTSKTFQELVERGDIVAQTNDDRIEIFNKLREDQVIKTHWIRKEYHAYHFGTKLLEDLMGHKTFDFPKSIHLIEDVLKLMSRKESLILDIFSGSGSTAHAVMLLNAKDGGDRRHVQIQLPEEISPDTPAYTNGYRTISQIAKKRIELAGKAIEKEYSVELKEREAPLDVGYRTYKLSDSNFKKWKQTYTDNSEELQLRLSDVSDTFKQSSSEEDILTELLLKLGYSLTSSAERINISELDYWKIAGGALVAYVGKKTPTLEQLREAVNLEPARLVMLDSSFGGDDELKTNVAQLCKANHIEFLSA